MPHKLMWGENPQGLEYMRIFGEIGIVNFGSTLKIQSKLANKGRLCMHLGQAANHPRDTYRFLNLATDRVILSRDVRWLGKVYGTYHSIPSIELADADEDLRSIADSAAPGG